MQEPQPDDSVRNALLDQLRSEGFIKELLDDSRDLPLVRGCTSWTFANYWMVGSFVMTMNWNWKRIRGP